MGHDESILSLVNAAIRAPSGDNTQPWRFAVQPSEGLLSIFLDETRDPSPMNAGQRMARIAIGAALENVLRTARRNGWKVSFVEPAGPALATVQITGGGASETVIDPVLTKRVTNRRAYDGRELSEEMMEQLRGDTPDLEGVRTCWIVERQRILQLAPIIGQADATMFGEPHMRRAFLGNVRFDAPTTSEVEEGLSLASLELSTMDRVALRTLRRLPDAIVRIAGIMRVFATKTRALVESASGLCLIVAPHGNSQIDVVVGRAMQCAWLALAVRNLSVQPMMSLCVLENVLEHGTAGVLACLDREKVTALFKEFRSVVSETAGGRMAFLMRFGFSTPPSGRTGRLPLKAVLRIGQSEFAAL